MPFVCRDDTLQVTIIIDRFWHLITFSVPKRKKKSEGTALAFQVFTIHFYQKTMGHTPI
jgi:hypothetical protein